MLRQGSGPAFFENQQYFLLKQGLLCLMAIKFCRVVRTISTRLLVKKIGEFYEYHRLSERCFNFKAK